MAMAGQAFALTWGKLVARAWTDPAFEKRLFTSPVAVLAENGVHLPEKADCKVITDGEEIEPDSGVLYLPFPKKPTTEELSEADLAGVAGGVGEAALALGGATSLTSSYLVSRIKTLNPDFVNTLALL